MVFCPLHDGQSQQRAVQLSRPSCQYRGAPLPTRHFAGQHPIAQRAHHIGLSRRPRNTSYRPLSP
jgi:hypothetical protein